MHPAYNWRMNHSLSGMHFQGGTKSEGRYPKYPNFSRTHMSTYLYHRFDIGSIWIHGQLNFHVSVNLPSSRRYPGWGEARSLAGGKTKSCGENNHKPSPSHHQFMAGISHQKWVYIKLLYHFCFTHMFESPVRRTAGKMSQSCWGPEKNNCSQPFLDRKVALKTGRSSRLLQQTLSSKDLLDSYLSWMVGRIPRSVVNGWELGLPHGLRMGTSKLKLPCGFDMAWSYDGE